MNLIMYFTDFEERVVNRVDLPQINTDDTYEILGWKPEANQENDATLNRLKNYLKTHPNEHLKGFINDIDEAIDVWADDYDLNFSCT